MPYCWPYAVKYANICAKLFVGVPWGTWNRLHEEIKEMFLPTEKPAHS